MVFDSVIAEAKTIPEISANTNPKITSSRVTSVWPASKPALSYRV